MSMTCDAVSNVYADAITLLKTTQEVGFCSADPLATLELTARTVRDAHIQPGEVILVVASPGRAALATFFGLLQAGVVPVLHPLARSDRLRSVAHAMGCRAILRLSGDSEEPRQQLVEVSSPTVARHSPGDVILLTSGTSGVASGCLHSFDRLLSNASLHADSVGLTRQDCTLVTLPLHYSFALVAQVLGALKTGGRLAIAAPPFSAPNFVASLADTGASVTSLTPWLVNEVMGTGWEPPQSLRLLSVGGAELPRSVVHRLSQQCGDTELALTYGLSEAGPRVSTLVARDQPLARLGSVGLPLTGVTVELRDTVDDIGELIITTPTAMQQRVGRVESDHDAFTRHRGIVTGDLFSIDPDGYMYFRGRRKDVILHHGTKLHLGSIRRVVEESPLVSYSRTQALGPGYALEVFVPHESPATAEEVRRDAMRRLAVRERPTALSVTVAGTAHK